MEQPTTQIQTNVYTGIIINNEGPGSATSHVTVSDVETPASLGEEATNKVQSTTPLIGAAVSQSVIKSVQHPTPYALTPLTAHQLGREGCVFIKELVADALSREEEKYMGKDASGPLQKAYDKAFPKDTIYQLKVDRTTVAGKANEKKLIDFCVEQKLSRPVGSSVGIRSKIASSVAKPPQSADAMTVRGGKHAKKLDEICKNTDASLTGSVNTVPSNDTASARSRIILANSGLRKSVSGRNDSDDEEKTNEKKSVPPRRKGFNGKAKSKSSNAHVSYLQKDDAELVKQSLRRLRVGENRFGHYIQLLEDLGVTTLSDLSHLDKDMLKDEGHNAIDIKIILDLKEGTLQELPHKAPALATAALSVEAPTNAVTVLTVPAGRPLDTSAHPSPAEAALQRLDGQLGKDELLSIFGTRSQPRAPFYVTIPIIEAFKQKRKIGVEKTLQLLREVHAAVYGAHNFDIKWSTTTFYDERKKLQQEVTVVTMGDIQA